ncbi:DUF4149 domain-containing protein [Sulfurihydrogenibium subterraneum]|uniref:DUF4149 domain-containing protein n=1 Tax=Sulfurihydrogenibium subterraneum TaxID=171121 RepID=UPI0004903241|nr:DUF4149 domain-containing protein [Sulfurihydrogenibium subterraneum]
MNKYITFAIVLLISILIGSNVFLSFVVAPVLFSNFDKITAGSIMQLIFPYYFKINWILGVVIYTIIGVLSFKDKEIVKTLKWFLVSVGAIVILNMAQDRSLLPMAKSIQREYVQALEEKQKEKAETLHSQFSNVHTVSSVINVTTMILEIFLLYNFLSFLKINRKEL